MTRRLTAEMAAQLLSSIDYILFDVDGVLWAGETVFPNAPETIRFLKQQGKKLRFVSNNAGFSRGEFLAKFIERGFGDVQEDDIVNSGYAAALYLEQIARQSGQEKFNRNVFVVGSKGLHKELRGAIAESNFTYGLELNVNPTKGEAQTKGRYDPLHYDEDEVVKYVEGGLPAPQSFGPSAASLSFSLKDLDFGAVVVGLDPHMTIAKLAVASICIQDGKRRGTNVRFIATNCDPQFPVGQWLLPGAGTMVGFIVTACNQAPEVICGKPDRMLFDILAKHEGISDLSKVLMVGDRLTTDIAFGITCGIQTLFVLTGCETMEDIPRTGITPTYTAEGVWELLLEGNASIPPASQSQLAPPLQVRQPVSSQLKMAWERGPIGSQPKVVNPPPSSQTSKFPIFIAPVEASDAHLSPEKVGQQLASYYKNRGSSSPSPEALQLYSELSPNSSALPRGLSCKLVNGEYFFLDHVSRSGVVADPNTEGRRLLNQLARGLDSLYLNSGHNNAQSQRVEAPRIRSPERREPGSRSPQKKPSSDRSSSAGQRRTHGKRRPRSPSPVKYRKRRSPSPKKRRPSAKRRRHRHRHSSSSPSSSSESRSLSRSRRRRSRSDTNSATTTSSSSRSSTPRESPGRAVSSDGQTEFERLGF